MSDNTQKAYQIKKLVTVLRSRNVVSVNVTASRNLEGKNENGNAYRLYARAFNQIDFAKFVYGWQYAWSLTAGGAPDETLNSEEALAGEALRKELVCHERLSRPPVSEAMAQGEALHKDALITLKPCPKAYYNMTILFANQEKFVEFVMGAIFGDVGGHSAPPYSDARRLLQSEYKKRRLELLENPTVYCQGEDD